MVIEEAKTSAENGLWSYGPGKSDARGNVIGLLKGGIIIPSNTSIESEGASDLPIVLHPEAIVVVS